MGSDITKAMGAQVVMVTSSNDTLDTSDVIQAPHTLLKCYVFQTPGFH
jgi:hypothetical protein